MLNTILINPHSLVPQEIQAQGHRAEAAFREAMEKGSVEVYRGRIMLIGQDRAGKTSLKKFLLGIPFDPEEESTVGIKVDPTKFEVEIDQVKNWQFTDHKKLDLSEYREDVAKITAEHIKASQGIILPKIEVLTYDNDFFPFINSCTWPVYYFASSLLKSPIGTDLSVNKARSLRIIKLMFVP